MPSQELYQDLKILDGLEEYNYMNDCNVRFYIIMPKIVQYLEEAVTKPINDPFLLSTLNEWKDIIKRDIIRIRQIDEKTKRNIVHFMYLEIHLYEGIIIDLRKDLVYRDFERCQIK
jgi:hypothetical protein